MSSSNLSQSIGTELVRSVFSTYLVVTLILTSFHLWQEYEDKKKQVDRELHNIKLTFEPGLSAALWQVNTQQVESILEGMKRIDIVKGARIEDGEGTVIAEIHNSSVGPQTSLDQVPFLFEIAYERKPGEFEVIGQASVYRDRFLVLQRMQTSLLVILFNSFIKTAVLVSAMIYFQRKIVIRPLTTLRNLLEDRNRWKDLSSVDQSQFRYELGELYRSFCQMASLLEQNFQRLENQVQEENEKFALAQQSVLTLGTMVAGIARDMASPSQSMLTDIALSKNALDGLDLYINTLFEGLGQDADAQIAHSTMTSLLHQIKSSWSRLSSALGQLQSIQTSIQNHIRWDDQLEWHIFREIMEESRLILDFKLRFYPVRFDILEELKIYGQRHQIGQILTHMLGFAADALRADEYQVKDNQPAIILRAFGKTASHEVWIEIEDDGPTMSEEVKKMILQGRFHGANLVEGVGLGLNICRVVVEKCKGDFVFVAPSELRGNCLRVVWRLGPKT